MYKRYEIIIGLKDKDSYNFERDLNASQNKFLNEFSEHKFDFSLTFQKGGYKSKNGVYILENSLNLTVIGNFEQAEINAFIDNVKAYFNQETVLYLESEINAEFRS